MPAAVDICNWALTELGVQTISSLDDDSEAARECNIRYEPIKDAVLRAFPWNSARGRSTLGREDETPDFEYAYSYALPTDYLRTLYLVDSAGNIISDDYPWQVENGSILTDLEEVNLVYTFRLDVVNDMDTLLREAIAARLASDLAYPLTKSNSLQEVKFKLYITKLAEAQSVDSQEGRPRKVFIESWVTVRG